MEYNVHAVIIDQIATTIRCCKGTILFNDSTEMTMTEPKLQNLNYDAQRRTGWYLSRLSAFPSMRSHGAFNRVVRQYGYKCAIFNTINPSLSVDHIIP